MGGRCTHIGQYPRLSALIPGSRWRLALSKHVGASNSLASVLQVSWPVQYGSAKAVSHVCTRPHGIPNFGFMGNHKLGNGYLIQLPCHAKHFCVCIALPTYRALLTACFCKSCYRYTATMREVTSPLAYQSLVDHGRDHLTCAFWP